MRTMSLILAFAFVMVGSSMTGTADSGLPGIGTFSYNGPPVQPGASVVMAAN
ncbi:hypothetical protein JQ615_15030 [Bradyrhizobium jicamae]|uniref:Uncharacterized protein n=2 Tax=Bradyrhizobium jicamae TaxID=280332 RepID=A0ABS5FIY1_9BRAD|nr:hypothetical protein [Bradyrhizobium jicamae]MBR0796707.1 hypothetical protein [Bradyrhizobium jicamae]